MVVTLRHDSCINPTAVQSCQQLFLSLILFFSSDNVAANQFPDADLQFDVVEWPYSDFGTSETPPYSHDIYAACSPSLGYPVDLNDIDTALDCDISTLDAYLHSTPPSSSASTVADLPFPNTMQPCSPTLLPSAPEQSPAPPSQQNPVEEFFPDLCEASTSVSAASDSTVRRRNYSSGEFLTRFWNLQARVVQIATDTILCFHGPRGRTKTPALFLPTTWDAGHEFYILFGAM